MGSRLESLCDTCAYGHRICRYASGIHSRERCRFNCHLVCGFAQTVYFAQATGLHSAFAHTLQIWNGSLFSLSLATNIVVTTLIAVRVA